MSRTPFVRFLGLSFALLLAACAAYQAQHQGATPPGAHDHGHAHDHAAVVRPSGEFSELAEDGQIARIRGEVEEVKANLARQGRYSCCVHPSCNECLLKYGQCHCRDVVRDEGPCCGECTEAWIEGRGTVEGVNAWDLLERKKKMLDDANRKGSGQGEGEKRPPHRHHH